jgi:hypothetical protein
VLERPPSARALRAPWIGACAGEGLAPVEIGGWCHHFHLGFDFDLDHHHHHDHAY